jgi:16S rRNA (cytosine967-C5)-methyltransferase
MQEALRPDRPKRILDLARSRRRKADLSFDSGVSFLEMSVSRARAIAFDVLERVEAEGAYASDLLHSELAAFEGPRSAAGISSQDAALATEIALGVLRQRRLLDFLLARQLSKPKQAKSEAGNFEAQIRRLDLAVTIALRMGLYQILFLTRVPARAAVNESVELVKRARKASAAALVNAVLRRAADDSGNGRGGGASRVIATAGKLLPLGISVAERLSVLYSHPPWLVEWWLGRYGEQQTLALLEADNCAPRLACAIHDPDHREEIIASLTKSGLRVQAGALVRNAVAVTGGSVFHSGAFHRGEISIQDEASQAIPLLLGVDPGNRVLDLCAAPGGKTSILARRAGDTGLVVAADRHAHRVRAMRAQFARLGLSRVRIVELDAAKAPPFGVPFDRILVDAPCSGTGTFARHPEIRWRLKPEQVKELHRLQVALLKSAVELLAPGGRIVYSTCSLEREENEEVVAEVVGAQRDLRALPSAESAAFLAPNLAPGVDAASLFDDAGYFRTMPGTVPTDGFFGAALAKAPR